MKCNCHWCASNRPHPASHDRWMRISSRLRVAESLDPADVIERKACETCGHVIELGE